MKYISIAEVLTLNQKVKEAELPYVIHLRDACGKQSLWIESFQENTDNKNKKRKSQASKSESIKNESKQLLDELITDYFHTLQFNIVFSEDGINFWLVE